LSAARLSGEGISESFARGGGAQKPWSGFMLGVSLGVGLALLLPVGAEPTSVCGSMLAQGLILVVVLPFVTLGPSATPGGRRLGYGLSAGLLCWGLGALLLAPQSEPLLVMSAASQVLVFVAAVIAVSATLWRWPWGAALSGAGLGVALNLIPFWASPVIESLPSAWRAEALRLSLGLCPCFVLSGSEFGLDVLRSEVLYRSFPVGQELPYAYPHPHAPRLVALVSAVVFGAFVCWDRARAKEAA
jgi:hypothetical protein